MVRFLPSDLVIRFLVLTALLTATTASVYGHLWIVTHPAAERAVADCVSLDDLERMADVSPATAAQVEGMTVVTLACVTPNATGMLGWAVAGTVLLLVTAYLLYRLLPVWIIRFRGGGLRELETGHPAIAAAVRGHAVEIGLPRMPRLWYSTAWGDSAAFGTGRRPHVRLGERTIRECTVARDAFTATVLHELAHVKNRDIRQTYLTIGFRRAFYALTVVPFLLTLGYETLVPRASTVEAQQPVAIVLLGALTLLTARSVLRARELAADTTAASASGGAVVAGWLGGGTPTGDGRRPEFLRDHPRRAGRCRNLAEPWRRLRSSPAQFFASGVAISVLSATVTPLAWQLLLASRIGGALPPIPLVVLLVALSTVLSTIALAWLVSVIAWRGVTAARDGSRVPGVARDAAAVAGLGLGVVVGEPASAVYANAGVLGVLDGVGFAGIAGAAVSVAALTVSLAALHRWARENAQAWPSARGGLFATGVTAGTVAFLPVYTTWWMMHDQAAMAAIYPWAPGTAEMMNSAYWPGPGSAWLQAVYLPLDFLSVFPGTALILMVPLLLTGVGLARSRTRAPHRWRPFGVAALLLITLPVLALMVRAAVGADPIADADPAGSLLYLMDLTVAVSAAFAAVTGLVIALRGDRFAAVTALATGSALSCLAALLCPLAALTAICGPRRALTCTGASFGEFYQVLFGYAGTEGAVKAIAAGWAGLAVGALLRRFARAAPAPDRPHGSRRLLAGLVLTCGVTTTATACVLLGLVSA
ncbi:MULTISPECIES: M48 family metalloprotease [Catenuloplanes]|uniref:Zn-dependent protease with chaperone function n=1 Tax=Catenuloplanes niger TaxID=587534 RepID=A0AAE3ZMG8_9ACTN|nr:M48 family metalloprotease [Catenuloplanes niger]MDR7320565.1 Zn-dependent protease with chaperone function [Catenuloplanes niger]